ncbi:calmodulin-like protein 3 [Euphorbia lathyris]|uniref:calmodulin-like protein 3 n=1 Tax=Euphorbia lathyris TaxID=212925 RepID=UPI003313F291
MAITFFLLIFLFFAAFLYFFPLPKHLYSFFSSRPSPAAKRDPEITRDNRNDNSNDFKDELKSVFATFDKNGDGFITKQELIDSLNNIRIFMTEKEVEEMLVKVDSNGDGLIDFQEFCSLCQNRKDDAEEEEEDVDLKEAFEVFDRDKDGLISVEELGSVLCSMGLKQGRRSEDCKEMIRKVDKDGDGMVNFDEFKKMMTTTSGGGGNSKNLISVF